MCFYVDAHIMWTFADFDGALPSRVPVGSRDPLLRMRLVESDAHKHRVMQCFGGVVRLCIMFY